MGSEEDIHMCSIKENSSWEMGQITPGKKTSKAGHGGGGGPEAGVLAPLQSWQRNQECPVLVLWGLGV